MGVFCPVSISGGWTRLTQGTAQASPGLETIQLKRSFRLSKKEGDLSFCSVFFHLWVGRSCPWVIHNFYLIGIEGLLGRPACFKASVPPSKGRTRIGRCNSRPKNPRPTNLPYLECNINSSPEKDTIQRCLAIDIHKHYVMIGGQNAQEEWALHQRRVQNIFDVLAE